MKGHGPDWTVLIWESLPMVGCLALLAWQQLGQVRSMAVAIARLVVQMLLLGVVLGGIIKANHPALVLTIALAMLAVAAHTVGARQKRGRWAIRFEAFGAMLVGASLVMAV